MTAGDGARFVKTERGRFVARTKLNPPQLPHIYACGVCPLVAPRTPIIHSDRLEIERELKIGDRVRLISMPQDPDPIPLGTLGTVVRVQDQRDWYQVEVAWDNGRQLMLATPDDCVEVVG
ncbi:MAG: DUF4314 domain-containing protein [Aureliella sp.]